MIEFVPIMLFILGWHPDRIGEIDLQRPQILFATMEECEQAGATMSARMSQAAQDKSGAVYIHRCMPTPAASEFDAAWAQREKLGQ